jgi:hypothetical protein
MVEKHWQGFGGSLYARFFGGHSSTSSDGAWNWLKYVAARLPKLCSFTGARMILHPFYAFKLRNDHFLCLVMQTFLLMENCVDYRLIKTQLFTVDKLILLLFCRNETRIVF